MKNSFLKSLFIILCFCPTIVFAEEKLYPKITEGNQEFYLYEVQKSEGLWAISKKFDVSQSEIHRYNPEIAQGLKFGTTLKIPVRKQVFAPQKEQRQNTDYKIHIVERSQTLYAISKLYNVSVEDILTLNPSITTTLKVGDSLKIPHAKIANTTDEDADLNEAEMPQDTSNFIYHEVKRKETLYSISKKYNVEINTILESNDIKTFPRKGQILRILKPNRQRNEQAKDTTIQTQQKTDTTAIDTIAGAGFRIAILLPFKLNLAGADKNVEKFVDFYRGILLATDEAKKQGISSTLFVYDTGTSEAQIDSILAKDELKNVDLIIGPAYTNQVQKVTDFAKAHEIYTLVPFTQKIKDIDTNPYIIQFNPSEQTQLTIAKQKLLKKIGHRHIVLACFENNRDEGNTFANSLLADLQITRTPHSRCIINVQNADSICKTAINENAVLLLASTSQERVRPILRIINRKKIGTNLELVGFDNWELSLLNDSKPVYFSSLFMPTSDFSEAYKQKYERYFGVSSNSFPKYDRLGYDLMQNMLAMLDKSGKKNKPKFQKMNNVQSDLEFRKVGDEGGWVNENVYLIHLAE